MTATGRSGSPRPVGFIFACAVAFCLSVIATIHFCRSMCCEVPMPGGWTMSMMWLRMPAHTWAASAAGFLSMWLAMMVAMMLPSALPMFLNSRRPVAPDKSTASAGAMSLVASGYFAVWLAAGAVVYGLGVVFAAVAMRSESFSRAAPFLSGAALVIAGGLQFTRWKTSALLRCRVAPGCAAVCPARGSSFLYGCKQGAACCVCCAGLLIMQLALGAMNPFVMAGIAAIVAAEKLLPRPDRTARVVGLAAILLGIGVMARIVRVT